MAEHVKFNGGPSTATEKLIARSILKHLREHDVLVTGLRIHDHEFGDVEIDAFIIFPDVGIGVIEVKGSQITFADGLWWQATPEGKKEIDPSGQALRGLYSLRRFIERQNRWSRGKLRGDWFLAFPDTHLKHGEDLGPQGRRETIFGKEEHEAVARRIYDILARPGGIPTPAKGWNEQLIETLRSSQVEVSPIEERLAKRIRHSDQLTQAQTRILDLLRNNQQMELIGGAGTGKTWLAIEQARRWSKEGLRVAFLTYTRGLSQMVINAMSDLPIVEQPAFTGTFHYLGYQWGVKPSEANFDDSDYWITTGPGLFSQAAAALPQDQKFDAFVIDEAQDFAESWWNVLFSAAKNSDELRLAVFRDDSQDVFEGRKSRPAITLPSFPLDDNLRNARQVVETFAPLMENPVKSLGGEGFPTRIIVCEADEVISAADDAVSQLVDTEGWLPEHVALLTTRGRHPVQLEQMANGKHVYWNDFWDTDDVFYSTVSGFKGLERPAVVIAINGFHDHVDPKNLLYTAITRASDLVILVGTQVHLDSVFER